MNKKLDYPKTIKEMNDLGIEVDDDLKKKAYKQATDSLRRQNQYNEIIKILGILT